MPGVTLHSKPIKKRKQQVIVEEGEEGADPLEEEERAPQPLLDQYEKFPEYIEVHLKPMPQTLEAFLSEFNKHALHALLDQKARELIYLKSFPVVLKIFLVP